MATAYIFVETAVGMATEVSEKLRSMPYMASVDMVTGPFDVVAVVDAKDATDIGDIISENLYPIEGIVKTVTCVTIG